MPTSAPVTAPGGLVEVAKRVEDRLSVFLADEVERWSSLTPDLAEPLQSLAALVDAGGKRLRPAFCYWAFVAAGGEPEAEIVVDVGAAFEMLQAFALLHDDVMDDSACRRGLRTTHFDFADRHVTAHWRGEPRRFGEAVAVLTGDLAHVYADILVAGAPPEAIAVWNELRIELNMGQYLDVLGTARGDTDAASARRIARYKSGKYTIERPLHVGAALNGRLLELQPVLSAYGDPLGEAFQLRDDVLGAFGKSVAIGKPVGDDLRDGKPTPLLSAAVASANAAQSQVLARVGDPRLTRDDVAEVQQVIVATGALREIESTIEWLTASAIEAIEAAPIVDAARLALIDLAAYVSRRAS
jgi:geranylgeranyl diphosphate synthase type I